MYKILIVDDEVQVRVMVHRAIRKLWPDIELAQASDGIQAVQIAKEFLPDILILDLVMPGQDGIAVLRDLEKDIRFQSTLVLGITGYNTPENIKKLMDAGAITCLTKPFGPEDLKRVLDPYLGGEILEEEKMYEKTEIKRTGGLVNVMTFLGFMISGLQLTGPSQTTAADLVQTVSIQKQEPEEESAALEKVSVLPFESSNEYVTGKAFSETLISHLSAKIKELTIVERRDIEKVLFEQKLILTGAVRQEKMQTISGLEAVDALITGSIRTMEYFGESGGAIVVTAKIVDVRNGRILWMHKEEAQCYAIGIDKQELAEELINRAAKKISRQIKTDLFSEKQKV